jgi:NTP pyrophosphatase (non-canonical NTP hydrolase)
VSRRGAEQPKGAHEAANAGTAVSLPARIALPALQAYVAEMVVARDFTRDRNEIFILLTEEVGELATELKCWACYPERFDRGRLALELADVLLYLLDLANGFGVALAAQWPAHEAANDARFAARRQGAPPGPPLDADAPLNALVAHVEARRRERRFEDTPERLAMLLSEELGEIATEVRKSWKGRADARHLGDEIIDALTYVLRIAHTFQVDLEGAVREKEAHNATRVWTY